MTQNKKPSGFLLIDKPQEWTSHDVVNKIRNLTDVRKVGHAGTLDPLATGLLIVAVSRAATRNMQYLVGLDKTYEAVFALGATSDTQDREGNIKKNNLESFPNKSTIDRALEKFEGKIRQKPPKYSAIKVKGKRLYEHARKGEKVDIPTRTIHIFDIKRSGPLANIDNIRLFPVKIRCSSGTYIRSLARDLGLALQTGGYLHNLRRTHIGPYSIDRAVRLDQFTKENIRQIMQDITIFLKEIDQKPR